MARVTIGVPVYNGADLLPASLECLRTQSFEDIQVLIGDNASTDATGDIASDFAARDPRFVHVRRPENLGVMGNFRDLSRRAQSPLFCWRAHDDASSSDYVERLVALFDADPNVRLAVSKVVTEDDVRRRAMVHRYPKLWARPRIAGVLRHLFGVHASWIYGVWDRETLVTIQDRVAEHYRHLGGWDDLAMFPLILDGQVAGTNGATFTQRVFRAHLQKADLSNRRPTVADLRRLRSDFRAFCQQEIAEREWSSLERHLLDWTLDRYVDRRGYSRRKLRRRATREGEGEFTGKTLLPDDTG